MRWRPFLLGPVFRSMGWSTSPFTIYPERAFMFRPAIIQPMHGIVSRTRSYRIGYAIMGPFLWFWRAILPGFVTTTEKVGRAMLVVARNGNDGPIVENRRINELAAPPQLT